MSALDKKVLALLVAGFGLVIALMLASGQRGLSALRELGRGSTGLLNEERAGGRALSNALALENEFDLIFYSLPTTSRMAPDELQTRLAALESAVRRSSADGLTAAEVPDRPQWSDFEGAGLAFVEAVRASAAAPASATPQVVARAHAQVLAAAQRLSASADHRNEELVARDQNAFAAAVRSSIMLLAATGGLAVIVAVATVALVRRLLARLAWQRAELSRLSSDILHTQEDTLRKVSHDLHDEIGQTLTAIDANLGALQATSQDWAVRGRVEDCIGLVQDLMGQTRSMSQLLRPSILDDFGLSASLESLVDGVRQRTGLDVSYRSEWNDRLPGDTETHLYRIAQEALTNVTRHSNATRVEVALTRRDEHLQLTVEDNGRGLPPAPRKSKGVGLNSMRARVEQIAGDMTMENRAGGGLRIVVTVPLVRAREHVEEDALAVS